MKKLLMLFVLVLWGCESLDEQNQSLTSSKMFNAMPAGERVDFILAKSTAGSDLTIPTIETFGTATTCYRAGEEVLGSDKICYYKCVNDMTAINQSASAHCPTTIKRQVQSPVVLFYTDPMWRQ